MIDPHELANAMVDVLQGIKRMTELAEESHVPPPTSGLMIDNTGQPVGNTAQAVAEMTHPPGYRAVWKNESGVAVLDVYRDAVEFGSRWTLSAGYHREISEEWDTVEDIDFVVIRYVLEEMGFYADGGSIPPGETSAP